MNVNPMVTFRPPYASACVTVPVNEAVRLGYQPGSNRVLPADHPNCRPGTPRCVIDAPDGSDTIGLAFTLLDDTAPVVESVDGRSVVRLDLEREDVEWLVATIAADYLGPERFQWLIAGRKASADGHPHDGQGRESHGA